MALKDHLPPKSDFNPIIRGPYEAGKRRRPVKGGNLNCRCVNCGASFLNRKLLRNHFVVCDKFDDIQILEQGTGEKSIAAIMKEAENEFERENTEQTCGKDVISQTKLNEPDSAEQVKQPRDEILKTQGRSFQNMKAEVNESNSMDIHSKAQNVVTNSWIANAIAHKLETRLEKAPDSQTKNDTKSEKRTHEVSIDKMPNETHLNATTPASSLSDESLASADDSQSTAVSVTSVNESILNNVKKKTARILNEPCTDVIKSSDPGNRLEADDTFNQTNGKRKRKITVENEAKHARKKVFRDVPVIKLSDTSSDICEYIDLTADDNGSTSAYQNKSDVTRSKNQGVYTCVFCPLKFRWQSRLARHVKQEHQNLDKANDTVLCSLCGAEFPSKLRLDEHLESHRMSLAWTEQTKLASMQRPNILTSSKTDQQSYISDVDCDATVPPLLPVASPNLKNIFDAKKVVQRLKENLQCLQYSPVSAKNKVPEKRQNGSRENPHFGYSSSHMSHSQEYNQNRAKDSGHLRLGSLSQSKSRGLQQTISPLLQTKSIFDVMTSPLNVYAGVHQIEAKPLDLSLKSDNSDTEAADRSGKREITMETRPGYYTNTTSDKLSPAEMERNLLQCTIFTTVNRNR